MKTFKYQVNDSIFILLVKKRQPILFPISTTFRFLFFFLFEGLIYLIHTLQRTWHYVCVI